MPTVLMVNGHPETLFSPRDFQALVDKHMGFDAMKWFRNFADEHETLQSEVCELEAEVEILRGSS